MSDSSTLKSNTRGAWRRLELHELSKPANTISTPPTNEGRSKNLPRARQFSPERLNRNALRTEASAEQDIPPDLLGEIERIGRNAREEAARKGFAEGKQQGLQEGHAAGHTEGYKTGHSEGYQDGHKEGYEAGLREGQFLSGEEARKMQLLANNLEQSLSQINLQISEALIALALDIARQVVRTTLKVRPEYIVETVQDILLTETSEQGFLRIRMHPEDITLVRRFLKDDPRLQRWQLLNDANIERGGCVAETALGSIDATLPSRWSRVAGLLQENTQWVEES